ncbi:MAG: fimbrial biogenesis chaperone [Thiobacillus sp.]
MFASIFEPRFRAGGFSRRSVPAVRMTLKGGWLLAALLILLPLHPALADLMVAPTRIVFDKNQRTAQLDLINSGTETATYRISIVNRRMSETGEFSAIDSPGPGEQFAGELLRYSPRQVVLAPGIGQTVRISLRKPADLPAGEYRSHLIFEKIAAAKGSTSIETQDAPTGEVSVQLTMLAGISIPVIVRHGETAASVTLAGLELHKPVAGQAATLAFVMQRSGNRSVYGDLGATFTPQGGAAQEVGKAGGVAVYTPNPLRRVKLELKPPSGLLLARGTLRVTFRDRPEAGGKLLAEAAIELP